MRVIRQLVSAQRVGANKKKKTERRDKNEGVYCMYVREMTKTQTD